jgi:hypothetical protein
MAPWSNEIGLESALDALAAFAGTSTKELKSAYFLFGVPASWDGDGMQLVVLEVEGMLGLEEVHLIELQLPVDWLGTNGIGKGGSDLDQINMLHFLEDASFGIVDADAAAASALAAFEEAEG